MAFAFPLLSRSAGFLLRSGHRRTVPVKARPALFFGAAGAAAALAPVNPSAGMQCPPLKAAENALPPKDRKLAEARHPFPARRSALCAGPKDAAPVAPAGLSAGYFDYKIAFFFVKKVFACCGPGIPGCFEPGTAKRFSLALSSRRGLAPAQDAPYDAPIDPGSFAGRRGAKEGCKVYGRSVLKNGASDIPLAPT